MNCFTKKYFPLVELVWNQSPTLLVPVPYWFQFFPRTSYLQSTGVYRDQFSTQTSPLLRPVLSYYQSSIIGSSPNSIICCCLVGLPTVTQKSTLCILGFVQSMQPPLGGNQPTSDPLDQWALCCIRPAAAGILSLHHRVADPPLMLLQAQDAVRTPPCTPLVLGGARRGANHTSIHHPSSQPSSAAVLRRSAVLLGNRLVDLSSAGARAHTHSGL